MTANGHALATAVMGDFSCEDEVTGARLLAEVVVAAKDAEVQFLVGPMNHDTWHSYRFVIESDGSQPFFLEPKNPDFYPKVMTAGGLDLIATYCSSRVTQLIPADTSKYADRLKKKGVTVRPFDRAHPIEELKKLYQLSLATFSRNYLYTPIDEASFIQLYEPVLPYVNPRYVHLAEMADGTPRAFIFAIPDFDEGASPSHLIFKTYASDMLGLGRYLLEMVTGYALDDGFKGIIHALMHEGNISLNASGRLNGKVFRRYGLYGKKL